jgi:hypothetical protein
VAVLFDATISGTASAALPAPFRVIYVAADVLVAGPGVGQMGQDVADHISRAGWFSLGDNFDIGTGAFERWRDPVWFNFTHTLWTPDPSTDAGGNPLSIIAPWLRYWLSPGTSVHLHIFGT